MYIAVLPNMALKDSSSVFKWDLCLKIPFKGEIPWPLKVKAELKSLIKFPVCLTVFWNGVYHGEDAGINYK